MFLLVIFYCIGIDNCGRRVNEIFRKDRSKIPDNSIMKLKTVFRAVGQALLMAVFVSASSVLAFAANDNFMNLGGAASAKEWTTTDLILAIIIAVVLIAFIGSKVYKKLKKPKGPIRMFTPPQPGESMYTPPSKANTATLTEGEIIEKLEEKFPGFPIDDFKNYVNEVYKKIENAWTTKTAISIRAYETDSLYETHENQIRGYIYDKRTNHHEIMSIQSTLVTDYKEEDEIIRINVRLIAVLKDYTIDDRTEELVLGNKEDRIRRIFKLGFVINKNYKDAEKMFDLSDNCPICGESLVINNEGECDHCKKIVPTGEYHFLLDTYSSEETF